VLDAVPFTPTEQRAVLVLLVRGASPLSACQQLQIDIDRFWTTYRTDRGFSNSLDQMYETLTLNVVAVLYRAAMEGNVVAQRLWLQHRSPLAWSRAGVQPELDWENLTHEQIREIFEQEQWIQQACRLEGISPP